MEGSTIWIFYLIVKSEKNIYGAFIAYSNQKKNMT